jgi:putative oxidoreductase
VIPERYAPQVYCIFREVFAFVYLVHGLQKLFGMFGGQVVPLASMLGAAAIIELVAGLLLLVGLFTRPAAFIASGEMAAAYFIAHFPRSPWPVLNGGEPPVLLCFAFLYIAARGAGPWSVDAVRSRSA